MALRKLPKETKEDTVKVIASSQGKFRNFFPLKSKIIVYLATIHLIIWDRSYYFRKYLLPTHTFYGRSKIPIHLIDVGHVTDWPTERKDVT